MTLRRGLPVHEDQHQNYWEILDNIGFVIKAYNEAQLEPPWPYRLYDAHDHERWIGLGFIPAGEDINDLAWLWCWHLQRDNEVGFIDPEEIESWREIVTSVRHASSRNDAG